MKRYFFPLFWVVLAGCDRSPAPPPAPSAAAPVAVADPLPAIKAALRGYNVALSNSLEIIKPTANEMDLARWNKQPLPQPHAVNHLIRLAADMREVDLQGTPEVFRMAWIDLVHAAENYHPDGNAVHEVAAAALGVVAARTGSKALADSAAKQIDAVNTLDDFTKAAQRFEACCLSYGIQFHRSKFGNEGEHDKPQGQ